MTGAKMTKRKRFILCVVVMTPFCLLMAFQAIVGIVTGNLGGRNYYGQPVGPVLQLIFLSVAAFVGIVKIRQHVHKKPISKKRKRKRPKPDYLKYPHEGMPWK